jgi:hypothetical protein
LEIQRARDELNGARDRRGALLDVHPWLPRELHRDHRAAPNVDVAPELHGDIERRSSTAAFVVRSATGSRRACVDEHASLQDTDLDIGALWELLHGLSREIGEAHVQAREVDRHPSGLGRPPHGDVGAAVHISERLPPEHDVEGAGLGDLEARVRAREIEPVEARTCGPVDPSSAVARGDPRDLDDAARQERHLGAYVAELLAERRRHETDVAELGSTEHAHVGTCRVGDYTGVGVESTIEVGEGARDEGTEREQSEGLCDEARVERTPCVEERHEASAPIDAEHEVPLEVAVALLDAERSLDAPALRMHSDRCLRSPRVGETRVREAKVEIERGVVVELRERDASVERAADAVVADGWERLERERLEREPTSSRPGDPFEWLSREERGDGTCASSSASARPRFEPTRVAEARAVAPS